MLAFSSASRTFACKRLAQGPSRPVSAFLGFMREYLDPIVKVDRCAHYVDYIGFTANKATDPTQPNWEVFKYNRPAGLKLAIKKAILEADRLKSLA